jgi:hypothetical protein
MFGNVHGIYQICLAGASGGSQQRTPDGRQAGAGRAGGPGHLRRGGRAQALATRAAAAAGPQVKLPSPAGGGALAEDKGCPGGCRRVCGREPGRSVPGGPVVAAAGLRAAAWYLGGPQRLRHGAARGEGRRRRALRGSGAVRSRPPRRSHRRGNSHLEGDYRDGSAGGR